MRIAHFTDLHVELPPTWAELHGKRWMGSANLYLLGRRGHFTDAARRALVEALGALEPDGFVCTGDLTAQALEREFDAAWALLQPVIADREGALLPGNHDVYTPTSFLERRIERRFGPWTGAGDWPRLRWVCGVACVMLDVARPGLLSTGYCDEAQLDGLNTLLGDRRLDGQPVFVMLHYPLRDRRGQPYGPPTRNLRNAAAVEQVLTRHADRITAVLHGHEHHGFRTQLVGEGGTVTLLDPGAAGYAWLPGKRRTAHFCVYELDGPRLSRIERYTFDGERFVPEPGGAWGTGG